MPFQNRVVGMRSRCAKPFPVLLAIVATLAGVSGCSSCRSGEPEQARPELTESVWREAVTAFYTGLAAMQTTQEVLAREKFERVRTLAPQEPAAWANIGLLLLRQQDVDQARTTMTQAATQAPDSADIQKMLALVESRAGNLPAAIRHWTRALELRPADARAAFALARDTERQGGAEADAAAQRALETLLRTRENLAVRLEMARLAAKRGDAEALRRAIAPLAAVSATWPAQAREQLEAVQEALATPRAAATRVAFIKNFLVREPAYRSAMAELTTPLEAVGEPLDRFLVLKNPEPRPAAPDTELTFAVGDVTAAAGERRLPRTGAPSENIPSAGTPRRTGGAPPASTSVVGWVGAVSLSGEGPPVVVTASATDVRVGGASPAAAFPSGKTRTAPGPHAVVAADLNYDFRTDLVLAGAGGLRILRQLVETAANPGAAKAAAAVAAGAANASAGASPSASQTAKGARFVDVTAATKLPASLLQTPAYGAWAADVDTDGDLDLVVAAVAGAPSVLRNNGDGTFAVRTPFVDVAALRGFVWADFDGDGVPDAALLQADGRVRMFLNLRGGEFREQAISLPAPAPSALAAIAAIELSGDALLDVIGLGVDGAIVRLSNPSVAAPALVTHIPPPPGGFVPGGTRLLVADLDNNAAADLIVTTSTSVDATPAEAGASHILLGGPVGTFHPLKAHVPVRAFDAADLDEDGRLELLGLRIAASVPAPPGAATPASTSARASAPTPASTPAPASASAAAPATAVASSRGTKAYHWQRLRPRAATATGDQRINAFGIGGEVEVRTGPHVQKQTIVAPVVHVGLGEAPRADVIRIVWPNGVLQSEFDKPADTAIAADQRLKGSCPWLFAWNGREMGFVTDLIWRSPLGLRINAQVTADASLTEDRIKVRGDQLVPRDGAYDLRITADLWETHFFDLVSLLVVDHPAGTEVFIDERFAVPSPPLDAIVTGPVQPFAAARDDRGNSVAETISARDDRHFDFAGRGAYQGITRDHAIELELPESAPRTGPLWLVAQGWVHPTDSSINVAIAQGDHAAPRGLSLAVADANGRFREVRTGLGFPSGKDKTVLLDLTGLFPPAAAGRDAAADTATRMRADADSDARADARARAGGRRRLRLSTNLEIFWDRLGWAEGRPDARVAPRRLDLASADLRYRGFSVTEQRDPSTPERPRYQLAGTAPRWLDLEGFYTRFGDVRELLLGVDDRYVIMNAGDELALRFPEAPAPASGLVRDFIVVGDGWVKDGDYNTAFSRTVLPLPTHASGRYDRPPGRLEDDPVFRAHPADFELYHTRYVSPATAREALRARPPASPGQLLHSQDR